MPGAFTVDLAVRPTAAPPSRRCASTDNASDAEFRGRLLERATRRGRNCQALAGSAALYLLGPHASVHIPKFPPLPPRLSGTCSTRQAFITGPSLASCLAPSDDDMPTIPKANVSAYTGPPEPLMLRAGLETRGPSKTMSTSQALVDPCFLLVALLSPSATNLICCCSCSSVRTSACTSDLTFTESCI